MLGFPFSRVPKTMRSPLLLAVATAYLLAACGTRGPLTMPPKPYDPAAPSTIDGSSKPKSGEKE
jgi:predicted small lipoprotein YifL